MSKFTGKRMLFPLCSVLLLVVIVLFCTKKNNPVSNNDDTPEQKIPTLTIITPTSGTSVDNATDSITVKAVIANSDYIDSLKINGIKISLLQLGGDTVSLRLPLGADTAKIIVAVYYQKTSTLLDSVIVFKKPPAPAFNGLAKISGTLMQESSSPLAKKLAKRTNALNAQGVRVAVEKVLPVSGADIMVYDAEALSTASDTTVKTDSAGNWAALLEPGKYFIFAVYFDREKLEIVTTSLPDIAAEKDVETKTDSAIAVSDDISPMLLTFLDAAEANDDNMFIGSEVPKGLPLVMSFSEPMTRASAGDSVHGIVLGLIEADSGDLSMTDTIPVRKLWGPDGKELRLIPAEPLVVGKAYKVVIPSATKDLALNKIDNEYSGVFSVAEATSLPPFALKATMPADKDTIQAGMPIECIFTRQIDGLSLNKKFSITSATDSSMSGFFEVKGNIARFVNKMPWQAGANYTMTLSAGVKDLIGDSLGTASSFSFFVRPKDAFEQKLGVEGLVAMAVKEFTGAFIAGDIDRFSQSFHPSFELIDASPDGQVTRIQLATFLANMRSDIEMRNRLSKYGIIDPVFYYPVVNGKRFICWKLIKGATAVYFEDLGMGGSVGGVPRVITLDNKDVTDSVRYVNRGIVYKGETLYFSPDMSKTFVDESAREKDPNIFGKLLRAQTNVETRDIMMSLKNDFIIRNLTAQEGNDTAIAMLELISEEQYLNGLYPGPLKDPANPPPTVTKRVNALQTKMVFVSGKWMVLQIAAKEIYAGDKTQFTQQAVADTSFVIKNFEQTRPIELINPKLKSIAVPTPIKLEWSAPKPDGIGGYLVAISNKMSGGTQGLLIFTRKMSLTIAENGAVDSTAQILSVDPKSLPVPLPGFNARLTSLTVGDSDVYVWKVVGLADTTASVITAGAMLKIIADSDFGSSQGPGIFTLMSKMPDLTMNLTNTNTGNAPVDNQFSDRDGDMFPDWLEKAFATSPDDPGSYPNFSLDTDLDGYPDFMEQFAGSKLDDASSKPVDANPADNIPDLYQKKPEWRPSLAMDDDKDGFPNEVEMIFGTDPWNAASKPAKSIKASVPVNTYFGGIKFGDQGWKRLNLSLLSDTTGDFALIKSTELEGVARGGVDLSVRLYWNNGEWVFFMGLVNGPNTGKFIKVRFHNEGTIIRGAVDMADKENGGGPYIGEFFASLDSIKDFNNIGGMASNPIVNPNQQGPLNIGPPPMDRVKRPDSGSVDMKLTLSFSESTGPVIVVDVNGDNVSFEKPFWAPGQFPAMNGFAPASSKQYRVEGNLHRLGNTGTAADTLVLVGIIEFNRDNGSSGTIRQKYDCILFITGIADPRKPVGTWSGWYTQTMGPVNEGPKPFIGAKDSVDAALSRTGNTGLIMQSQKIVTIASVGMEGNIWIAKVDTQSFFIMEKMGDFNSVMVKDFNGKLCVILSERNSQGTQPPNPPQPNTGMQPFGGDSLKIVGALAGSSNKVKLPSPNGPVIIMVDPVSLHRENQATGGMLWVASDAGNAQHKIMFLAMGNDKSILIIEEGLPVAKDIGGTTQPGAMIPYGGDSLKITTALSASFNKVKLMGGAAPIILSVDPATLHRENPTSPEMVWVAADAGNPQHRVVFLAPVSDLNMLAIEENMPVVKDFGGTTQPPQPGNMQPYQGDSIKIAGALAASTNKVKLQSPNGPVFIPVDAASLRHEIPASGPATWTVADVANPQHRVVFMAPGNDPNALVIEENVPVVKDMGAGQQPVVVPFTGDTMIIRTALANSGNKVVLEAANAAPIEVNPASLQRMQDPSDATKFGYAVSAAANPADMFVFMAGNAQSPQMLKLIDNMPVVFKK